MQSAETLISQTNETLRELGELDLSEDQSRRSSLEGETGRIDPQHDQAVFEPKSEFTYGEKGTSLSLSRTRYFTNMIDLDELIEAYVEWAERPDYLIFRNEETGEFKAVPASKRGNSIYAKRVQKRFDRLYRLSKADIMPHRQERLYSSVLMSTLTYTRQIPRQEAWDRVAEDFNRYMSHLRDRYGRVSAVRCFEAQKDGYPHIHVILVFHDYRFKTFQHGKTRRVSKKSELEAFWSDKEYLGFSDYQALNSWRHGLNYLVKYLHKSLSLSNLSKKQENQSVKPSTSTLRNLALLWVHRKRAFSISRRLDTLVSITQSEKEASKWVLHAIFTCSDVDLTKVKILDVRKWGDGSFEIEYASPVVKND